MTATTAPPVECETVHPSLPVPDVRAAAAFYAKLGFAIAFTSGEPPTIAGANLGRVQIFLEHGKPNGSSVFFVVEDADALHDRHRAAGVEIAQPLTDQPYGIRDYAIRDPWGHTLTFGHHLHNAGEPISIERVDVPLRLEKRLAALLGDLAKHKRMTPSQVIEEMMLHTNEGVGPHTAATLRHIAELKRRHGIEYDSHASYRWVERERERP